MHYREVRPPAELTNLVRYFWVIEHSDSDGRAIPFRLFAESCPGLVFFCRSGYAAISGVTTTSRSFSITGNFKMIGAYLFPYALPLLFRTSAKEFTEKQVLLSDIAPRAAMDLCERVMNAPNTNEQIRYISYFILGCVPFYLKKNVHAGVHRLMETRGNCGIDQVASVSNLSSRQLERNFSNEVGVSPKLLSRLIRFQQALRLPIPSNGSLTDIGLQAGYYDQSHFIRDFTSFAGITPKQYFGLHSADRADNFIQQ
jgi:AraC-like DNA-binding protein